MIIVNGISKKNLKIYPPAKLSTYLEDPFWIKVEYNEPIFLVVTIDRALSLYDHEEDTIY